MKRIMPHIRFEAKLKKNGERGCWLWRGATNSAGYGRMMCGSRRDGSRHQEAVQRFAYRFYTGPIPDGSVVYAKCQQRTCANPLHLRVATRQEMIRLAVKRGTWIQGAHLPALASHPGERNGRARLKDEMVRKIAESLARNEQPKNLAKQYGVTVSHISAIRHHRTRKYIFESPETEEDA